MSEFVCNRVRERHANGDRTKVIPTKQLEKFSYSIEEYVRAPPISTSDERKPHSCARCRAGRRLTNNDDHKVAGQNGHNITTLEPNDSDPGSLENFRRDCHDVEKCMHVQLGLVAQNHWHGFVPVLEHLPVSG